ncbi:MAG: DUF2330 domain-containing protein [Deltaproteobacteria bacterium]|nr:DUF2330 domain-containing protein [Deltaproteobacteria bacterium]
MGLALAAAALLRSGDASACGACYASTSESTVVNDHRMAFSIGRQQTVLWDSISYSGNPQEFAYVLPAKPGTRIEPSNDAWFTALDGQTRPIIMGPPPPTGKAADKVEWDRSGGGCSSAMESAAFGDSQGPRNAVEVVDKAAVGPYDTVTVRSSEPEALSKWLVDHGFAIPPNSAPIIASYVQMGYDFIALRLRPGREDVREMEPIRIVSPGTDTSLPLRLMQIGAGSKVGITLYVIGEGRYRTASFPDVPLDTSKLFWDPYANRSNYQELSIATMATENGRAFITEYADRPSFDPSATGGSGMTSNTGLKAGYVAACKPGATLPAPAPNGTTTPTGPDDAGASDAGDASDAGASDDAGQTSNEPPKRVVERKCDDLDVAIAGMNLGDVWVTRLRANLPFAALDDTLRLEPAPKQEKFDNIHQTTQPGTIPPSRIAPSRASHRMGTYAVMGLTGLVLSRIIRKRRSEKR